MKVYVVQNNDNILLGVFKTKKKAKTFMKDIGKKRWRENWSMTPWKLNTNEEWIEAGSESYNLKRR